MSFYDELLDLTTGRTGSVPCKVQTRRIDLDEGQFAGFVIDTIFDEFRKTSEWPERNLKFSEPEVPLRYHRTPSEVMTSTNDGARGVKAIFICGAKQVEELITVRGLDGAKYELKFGSDTMVFSIAEMPCCPPFSPGIVISVLGARLVTEVLQNRFSAAEDH